MARKKMPETGERQLGALAAGEQAGEREARSGEAVRSLRLDGKEEEPSTPSLELPRVNPRASGESKAQYAARSAALIALNADQVPYVVAGAYAMREHTGIYRDTKDLDAFCRRRDVPRALASLARVGFRVELTDPLWLAKGYAEDGEFVDVIFS